MREQSLIFLTCLISMSTASDLASCTDRLGLEDGRISDSQLSASSSHEPSTVGPSNARLNVDRSGGAWCPRELIGPDTSEYLEVDLLVPHVISAVLTQGRFGNGHGQEFAEAFKVDYWRPGMEGYVRYVNRTGNREMEGNRNTYSVVENRLDPPIVASKIRIVPHSAHARTVCMRIEVKGCIYKDGITSYSVSPSPYSRGGVDLLDDSYDGKEAGGAIVGGIGQLVDGKIGQDASGRHIGGYDWVGWKNQSLDPLTITFAFDSVRRFSGVQLNVHPANPQTAIGSITKMIVDFSVGGKFFNAQPVIFSGNDRTAHQNIIRVPFPEERIGKFVRVRIFFSGKWLAIGEVIFDGSEPLTHDVPEETSEDPAVITVDLAPNASNPGGEPDDGWESRYLGIAIGSLVTVIMILIVAIIFIIHRNRLAKRYLSSSNISVSQSFLPSDHKSIPVSTGFYHPTLDNNQLIHQHPVTTSAIYSEPIFRGGNYNAEYGQPRLLMPDTPPTSGEDYTDTSMEYASPLLLHCNTTSTSASPPPPRPLLSPPRPHRSTSCIGPKSHSPAPTHRSRTAPHHKKACPQPNWQEFFPRPPPGPPPPGPPEASFYAAAEICKGIGGSHA